MNLARLIAEELRSAVSSLNPTPELVHEILRQLMGTQVRARDLVTYHFLMEPNSHDLRAPLGFTRAADVSPDDERPGLLGARTLPFGVDPDEGRLVVDQTPSLGISDYTSKRSRFMTLIQASMKSCTNSSPPSSAA
jgi:hypothetical protein